MERDIQDEKRRQITQNFNMLFFFASLYLWNLGNVIVIMLAVI